MKEELYINMIQNWMEKIVDPIAKKLNKSALIKAITAGMMGTMPITLGVAAICIISNLPFPGWITFLTKCGIYGIATQIMQATLSMLAIYLVVTVAYHYAKGAECNGIVAATLSLGSFLILIPQYIVTKNMTYTAMESKYLGSDGILVGMILALCVSSLYVKLTQRKSLDLKMPESVPPMVSQSLSPTFVAMIIFLIIAVIKYLCFLTPYGNIFTMVNTIIATPIMKLGATPIAMILVYTFASLIWFFGVHPSPIISVYMPILTMAITSNVQAYVAGKPLPYAMFGMMLLCVYFSGQGNTIGLSLSMLNAKSEKYKALRPVALIPNIFNINEPVIFGTPVMLNPYFFFPMILATLIPGLVGYLYLSFIPVAFNPTIQMPWVTPALITSFLEGGWAYFLLILICMALSIIIWYPFFKIADKEA